MTAFHRLSVWFRISALSRRLLSLPAWRSLKLLVIPGICLLVIGEVIRVLALSNRHCVIPGRVYRCAQPTPADLRELAEAYGLRTVINLRGLARDENDPASGWYFAEAQTLHDLGLSQEDITLSANRLPPPGELRRLVEVLDKSEYPVLLHCKRGADRTGLASVLVRLLYTDDSIAEARRQLSPRYGHFRFGRTAAIDHFFDRYEAWLAREGLEHQPQRFRHWVTQVYSPGPARSELQWLDPVPNPVPADRGFRLRLRAWNRSEEVWQFQPGDQAAIHLAYIVASDPRTAAYRGKAGLFRATVPPGESIDLMVAVPPLKTPGTYALVAELIDARGSGVPVRANSFVQFGDAAILAEIRVK